MGGAVTGAAGSGAAAEKSKLQKHFGRADIFFFLVCTLVGIDGLGTLATEGGQGFTWLLVCLLLFAVPSAALLAELGAAFPDEGGPYVWVRMAFGRLAGAVNNLFYWVTNPVWMGGTLVGTALGGLMTFFHGGEAFSLPFQYVFAMVFIWAGVLFAILSFRVGKWIATIGALARFALLGLFSVLVVVYGVEHGFHGPSASSYAPTFVGFVLLVPLILFSLVGFELPSAAGEEMEDATEGRPLGHRQVDRRDRAPVRPAGARHPAGAARGAGERPGGLPRRGAPDAHRLRRHGHGGRRRRGHGDAERLRDGRGLGAGHPRRRGRLHLGPDLDHGLGPHPRGLLLRRRRAPRLGASRRGSAPRRG